MSVNDHWTNITVTPNFDCKPINDRSVFDAMCKAYDRIKLKEEIRDAWAYEVWKARQIDPTFEEEVGRDVFLFPCRNDPRLTWTSHMEGDIEE